VQDSDSRCPFLCVNPDVTAQFRSGSRERRDLELVEPMSFREFSDSLPDRDDVGFFVDPEFERFCFL
jgi:hypothetical protein